MAVYCNSFSGPFAFDDVDSIIGNPTIRQLQPIGRVLSPPRNGETVSGRPLLNLSLALNYALGGTVVWGYHAANLAIHVLNALLLWGILRRTLTIVEGGRWTEGGWRKRERRVRARPSIRRRPPSTVHRPPPSVHRPPTQTSAGECPTAKAR
jgi:hypothetical protein